MSRVQTAVSQLRSWLLMDSTAVLELVLEWPVPAQGLAPQWCVAREVAAAWQQSASVDLLQVLRQAGEMPVML